MVSKNKTRLLITLPLEVKTKLEKIAEEETRTVNNVITLILKEYIKNQDNKLE